MQRFAQFRELRKQATDLNQALADRKVIEKAKSLMMKRAKIDEPEVFRLLQKKTRER